MKNYVAALTYHSDVGTFRGARGAWRVDHTVVISSNQPVECPPPYVSHIYPPSAAPIRALFMEITKPLRRGTWVNPTKLLRDLLAKRRGIALPTI